MLNGMRILCCGLLWLGTMSAQSKWKVPKDLASIPTYVKVPAFGQLTPIPGLPRVLIVGDSISMYYSAQVREVLRGIANVYLIPDNARSTAYGLKNIDEWLGDGNWALIHFNWGLHDIATWDGPRQVSIVDYEANLRQLVKKLQGTGARLIWSSTTPVPTGSKNREERDVLVYNAVAKKVMEEAHIPINDLHAFIESRSDKEQLQRPANVHFRPEGSTELGAEVSKHILAALGSKSD